MGRRAFKEWNDDRCESDEWRSDEWGSDERRSDDGCSCRSKVPSCGLNKVLVRPQCYKYEEVKQYKKKCIPPKYELRYVKKTTKKPAYAPSPLKTSNCCCSLTVRYNKN